MYFWLQNSPSLLDFSVRKRSGVNAQENKSRRASSHLFIMHFCAFIICPVPLCTLYLHLLRMRLNCQFPSCAIRACAITNNSVSPPEFRKQLPDWTVWMSYQYYNNLHYMTESYFKDTLNQNSLLLNIITCFISNSLINYKKTNTRVLDNSWLGLAMKSESFRENICNQMWIGCCTIYKHIPE